jgi:putative phosphonate metabolism protein
MRSFGLGAVRSVIAASPNVGNNDPGPTGLLNWPSRLSSVRIAIFFTPPAKHRLTVAAARWLMRDAFQGVSFDAEADDVFGPEELRALTAEPRRYGFHATMKPPFRLAEGVSLADAEALLADFCRDVIACPLPSLRIATLGPFFALVPDPAPKEVDDLAARVVEAFEPLRAPLHQAELDRRRRVGLTPAQEAMLTAWGYPYVFDEFRFHMTLTGPVPAERQVEMADLLHRRFDHLLQGVAIDSLALFVEDAAGADFRVHAERHFDGAALLPSSL